MAEPPQDLTRLVDLSRVRIADVARLEGDSALEATLKRLEREVEHPREAVSGFASAI